MKWIGQHIWDFISRFRSDVYLEATETGTIASGGNLGLDSNNKIVKADTETGELSLADGSNDRVVTALGATMLQAESKLEFSSATGLMKIGADDDTLSGVYRQLHTSDDGGELVISGGSPTVVPSSTNKNGGNLTLQGGFNTGSGSGGDVVLKTSKGAGVGTTGLKAQTPTVTVSGTNVHLEEDVTLSFEGGTDGDYETTLTVVDPTDDRTITFPNATGTVALTSDIPTVADESPTNGDNLTHKYVKKTLSQANMEALHTGTTAGGFAGKLVDAPGANLQIIPTDIWLFIDDAGTVNDNSVNLVLGYGGTVLYQKALHLAKRFHYHTSSSHDSSYMMPRYLPEYASDITSGINESLTLTLDGAIDTGSITEMQVHLTYYIIDRS